MPAYLISTGSARCAIVCSAAALTAFGAMSAGCSRPVTESRAPHIATAQAVPAVARAADAAGGRARPAAYAASSPAAAAIASAETTRPSARDPLAGDVMERELGTASDGGYFAYPER